MSLENLYLYAILNMLSLEYNKTCIKLFNQERNKLRTKRTAEDKAYVKVVGSNIKFYRINNNCPNSDTDKYGRVSQEKLAELSNTSASMIANVEAPHVETTMSISFVRKVAEALNIPLYAFFLEKPVKNPPRNPFEDG